MKTQMIQAQIERVDAASSNAAKLAVCYEMRNRSTPLTTPQLASQMRLVLDKIMGEAGLYATGLTAQSLQESGGDVWEAVMRLRAFRATLERRYTSEIIDTREMSVLRRISSAFREIPGGQILGPSRDYTQRLLETRIAVEDCESVRSFLDSIEALAGKHPNGLSDELSLVGKVADLLKKEGLMEAVHEDEDKQVVDITRHALQFPAKRSAALQTLARGETGAIMALAYSAMRGQGGDHPTIGELRFGKVKLAVMDRHGRVRTLGRVQVTESENISKIKVGKQKKAVPKMSMGYGLCFGHNETKAICMGILDRSMRIPGDHAPAISQEFVLHHVDPADAHGAIHSLKMPAHTEFSSELSLIRQALQRRDTRAARGSKSETTLTS